MDADFKGELYGAYIYWESRISLPKFTCPQENKSTKFSDKTTFERKTAKSG